VADLPSQTLVVPGGRDAHARWRVAAALGPILDATTREDVLLLLSELVTNSVLVERMADRWGIVREGQTTVWFELAVDGRQRSAA
jgi:hypothetical protein